MTRTRRKIYTPYIIIAILLIVVVIVAFIPVSPSSSGREPEVVAVDSSLDLEKVVLPSNLENKIIEYEGFTVGFNAEKHQPNYVVWTLTSDKIDGPYSRGDVQFRADSNVEGCASLADYSKSGFDRGHMAPAADMKWSKQAMADCHLLTNMSPQDSRLNSGAWATVEKNARNWVQKHGRLIIVAGPVLSDRMTRFIGENSVPVPERFFKVVLAPDANPPMGIGFVMPNSYVEGGAQSTVVSIDDVETITGFDFFSELPDEIEDEVEQQARLRQWNK